MDERAKHFVGLALAGQSAERTSMDAGPERLDVLAPEGPDDLGDDESDRDEGLHRPEVGRTCLLSTRDERRVITDDRQGRRRDGTEGPGTKGRDADGEGVEDPRAECEWQREDESSHGGEVEYRYDEGDPLKWGVVPHADRGREIEHQDEGGERGCADSGEQDEGSAEGDRCETDEQVGALARYGGCRRPPHCAGLTHARRLAMRGCQ